MLNFHIDETHFKYLAIQKGNLADHLYDRHFWQVKYDKDIHNMVLNIVDVLPKPIDIHSVLDVGSGLGGFSAALAYNLGDPNLIVGLLDGDDDPAVVRKHSLPFNNMEVAKDFLRKNGLHNVECYTPESTINKAPNQKYDLIVSFQAWCFHFDPLYYIRFVKDAVQPGRTRLIIDVRNEKPDWVLSLVEAFGPFEVIYKRPKYSRMVFSP